MNQVQEKEYLAFISYKHEDIKWAEWLQNKLEYYRLPAYVKEEYPDLPEMLRPIFRDVTDLEPGNLPDKIKKALQLSRFLIVICSPRSAKSEWVDSEIKEFVAQGKGQNIIPFIIEGIAHSPTPDDECFPPTLRNLKKSDEIVGANINELSRDYAAVKVVASMLGLGIDKLWQRYLRAEEAEKQRIIEQNNKLFMAQSHYLAEKASDLVDDNNAFLGRLLALEALPTNIEEPERPYVPEAELALRKSCSNRSAVIHGHSSGCLFASFSPDGRFIVSGSADKTARIWNVSDCRQLSVLNHTESVDFACFNVNGQHIVTTSEWEKPINIWDSQTGQRLRVIEGHGDGVLSAIYTHDNKWIISASRDKTIRKWNAKTYKEELRIEVEKEGFRWAFPSPNGKFIISSGLDLAVRVWNADTGEQIKYLCSSKFESPYAIYSPDGKFIATAVGTHAIIWDANSFLKLLDIEVSEYSVNMLAFSPDGSKLATISGDKVIGIWDARVYHPIRSVRGQLIQKFQGHTMGIFSCQFSPDGKSLVTASWDKTIRIWDIDDHIVFHYDENNCAFSYAEFSPNNKLAAVVYNDNVIRLYEVNGFVQKGALIGHIDLPKFVHFSSDGKSLVSSSADNSVRVWDINKRICIKVFNFDKNLSEARFSPNDDILVISDYKHIYLYNTKNWSLLHDIEISGFLGSQFITFCPDGNKFATSLGAGIRIYDVNTGAEVKSVNVHPLDVSMLRFNANGDYLYFVSFHTLCRIDTETMTKIEKFEGHSENIRTFTFSSDQHFVATAAYDKTLRIWDVESRNHIHTCVGHTWGVSSVNFQPDGRTIITASFDGTFRKWDFPTLQTLIDELKDDLLQRPLTDEERKQYYLV